MQEAVAAGTWAQSGAGCFLDILPLTEGAPVERCRVGAAPAPFLPATPTAGAADGPLRPRRPPTVHWPDREGLGSGSGGFLRHAAPRDGAGGQRALEPGLNGQRLCREKPWGVGVGQAWAAGPQRLAEPSDTLLSALMGQLLADLPLPALGGGASHSEALLPILGDAQG